MLKFVNILYEINTYNQNDLCVYMEITLLGV